MGGVLRDSDGRWDAGFQKFVGRGSALNAEVENLCGYEKIVIESDCTVAIQLITGALGGSISPTIVR